MAHRFDDITIEQLRAVGGLKWSQHPDAIGSFVAEMDFGTAPPVLDAMHGTPSTGGLFGYLPDALAAPAGARRGRGFARARYGWEVPAERVRPLADVVAGLHRRDRASSPPPARRSSCRRRRTCRSSSSRRGWAATVIEVPMARDGERSVYDLDALDAAFAAGGSLLVLCNPHNPVGRVLEPEEMLAVAEVVERHGGRVFSDEIHAPLVYDGHTHVPYASLTDATAAHTVTAVSASKAWNLPGLKCAQLVLSNDADAAAVGGGRVHGRARRLQPRGWSRTSRPTRRAGRGWPTCSPTSTATGGCSATCSREQVPEIGYTPPEGTYLAWLDCRRARPRGPPGGVLPRARRGGADRRTCLRGGGRRASRG